MNRHRIGILVTIWIIGAAHAQNSKLQLFVGGGTAFTGPNFYVSVKDQGQVEIRKTSLPIVRPGKLTERTTSLRLSPSDAQMLLQLAETADDFADGCGGTLADGTSASLVIEGANGKIKRKCTNAAEWPTGRKTKFFLEGLNAKLPKKWQVF